MRFKVDRNSSNIELYEFLFEIVIKSGSSLVYLIAIVSLSKSDLGILTFAGSIAAFLTGLQFCSWSFRMNLKSDIGLNRQNILFQIFLANGIAASIGIAYVFFIVHAELLKISICLCLIFLGNGLMSIVDILWGLQTDLLRRKIFSKTKLLITLVAYAFTLLLCIIIQDIYIQASVPLIVWLFTFICLYKFIKFRSSSYIQISSDKSRRFPTSIETVTYGFSNLIAMLTYVCDNLLVQHLFGFKVLATYGMAFSILNIFVGIFGSSLQRIQYLDHAIPIAFAHILRRCIFATLCSSAFAIFIFTILSTFGKSSYLEVVEFMLLLSPYVFFRTALVILNPKLLSKYGTKGQNILNFFHIFSILILGYVFALQFSIYGIILAVDFSIIMIFVVVFSKLREYISK